MWLQNCVAEAAAVPLCNDKQNRHPMVREMGKISYLHAMSILFTCVYLCHEVHKGILHLTTAACLCWHPHTALGLFQRSHAQACHTSLAVPGTSLPCHSLTPPCWTEGWSRSWQQEARSYWHLQCPLEGMSPEGALGAHSVGLVTARCWWSK